LERLLFKKQGVNSSQRCLVDSVEKEQREDRMWVKHVAGDYAKEQYQIMSFREQYFHPEKQTNTVFFITVCHIIRGHKSKHWLTLVPDITNWLKSMTLAYSR
jgi:hypothetical protein